ncbi:DUF4013 domain-containing protein [Thermococcus sp. 21S7]|uniref:DUF4013 domain-containing protein n=1 Tax=Thermococcus sp. 21S7 TaxID=1638221 RepID=UPI00143B52D9|nr:DUF4013 domain-containing protein [Thermococcus sp. 21S7]NJE60788.1 DUF4013 domain-containing protein [Thermococcus sp. 21S7]
MGAMDAFVKTFSLMVEARKLYIPALVFSLILAPIAAYLLPEPHFDYTPGYESHGNVVVEEYGSDINLEDEFLGYLKELAKTAALLTLISFILGSAAQYATTRGALLHYSGENYRLGELLIDGVKHIPGVVVISLLFMMVSLGMAGIAVIPMVAGAFFLPAGLILIIIGILLLVLIMAITTSLSAVAVPLYVDKGRLSAAFEAFGLTFRNVSSSLAFGFLLWVGIIAVLAVSSPITLVADAVASEEAAKYIVQFLQAPFNALMIEFVCVGGVAFYRELQKMEELKKVDEELKELGIEV